eukprot:jgi/Mesvir1/4786/Mv11086-RA.1
MPLTPSGEARLSESGLNTDDEPSKASAGGLTSRWKLPMLHPLSGWRLYYEVILFASAIVTGFLIPVGVAWAPDLGDGWKIFFLTMDVYFLLDTILNFRLGYIITYSSIRRDPGGLLPGATAVEMAPRKVAQRYLRTWFLPDLLGSLPYDLIGWNSDRKAQGLKLLGLLRILKVMRLNRLQRMLMWRPSDSMFAFGSLAFSVLWVFTSLMLWLPWPAASGIQPTNGTELLLFRCVALMYVLGSVVFLFSHFAACIFYWVGRLQPPNQEGGWIYGQTILVDNVAVPVSEAPLSQQYLTCIYYAIVAVTSLGIAVVCMAACIPSK